MKPNIEIVTGDEGYIIPYTLMKFSGGEIQVRIDKQCCWYSSVGLTTNITSSDILMELLLVTDALRRLDVKHISLTCKYFPYARQDRVCSPGESLSVKVVCDIINSQHYDSVTIWDAHSDVTPALLNNCYNVDCSGFVYRLPYNNTVLIAPDAGAVKKVFKVAQKFKLPMIVAEKIRSPDTGEIFETKCDLPEEYCYHDILIVDDICDGGRTFVELSKVLSTKTTGNHSLYVTHGIFSKGFEELKEWFDAIYTPNSFVEDVPEFVTILK